MQNPFSDGRLRCASGSYRRPARRVPRGGYVLLLTLGIIGLAAIGLAGFARRSLGLALSAQMAQEEAQRRWGEISCRRVLLDRAEQIFQAQQPPNQSQQPRWPLPSRMEARFELGGQQFLVVLADENAKVNLNAVLDRKPNQLEHVARVLCEDRNLYAPRLALRPQPPYDGGKPRFESWGQVYDYSSVGVSAEVAESIAAAAVDATCWGDGRLNVGRASELALTTVGRLVLDAQEVSDLLKARRQWSGASIEDLLRQLDLRSSRLTALRRLLGDHSSCFSLWVRVHTRRRDWSSLAIVGDEARGGPPLQTFVW